MKKLRVSNLLALSAMLLLLITGCVNDSLNHQDELFEDMIPLVSGGIEESRFCELFELYFDSSEDSYKCEGENGYYSELSEILLPFGYLEEVKIGHKVENEYVYFFFVNNNEKVYVGYYPESNLQYIYGIE